MPMGENGFKCLWEKMVALNAHESGGFERLTEKMALNA